MKYPHSHQPLLSRKFPHDGQPQNETVSRSNPFNPSQAVPEQMIGFGAERVKGTSNGEDNPRC